MNCSELLKGSVSSVSLNNFGRPVRHGFLTNFVTLTNDVAELSPVVRLTSADVTLDTDGQDCSFKQSAMI